MICTPTRTLACAGDGAAHLRGLMIRMGANAFRLAHGDRTMPEEGPTSSVQPGDRRLDRGPRCWH